MSQELLAIIGEKEVELRQMRAQMAQLQEQHDQLCNFVAQAAKRGVPIRLADASECEQLPEEFGMPPVPDDAAPIEDVTYTPAEKVIADQDSRAELPRLAEACGAETSEEPALSH